MKELFLEAESFSHKGGWVIDQQSMEVLHSAYLMAHGLGEPVEDAWTDIEIPESGSYHFWALTRDWTAVWGVKDSAGKFLLKVDGEAAEIVLGTNGKEWAWQKAGTVALTAGKHRLALHDLTGFNGRCDAVYITDSEREPDSSAEGIDELRKRLNWKEIYDTEEVYDLVVVGGGVAGICTALTAIRNGVSTVLINDRPVLGGCNSSEIRVCMGGMTNLPPYDKLGNVVKEIAPIAGYPTTYGAEYYEDHRKRLAFEVTEGRNAAHKLMLGEAVTQVEQCDGKVCSVVCTNIETGKKTRVRGRLFSDCSGDAVIARAMGAEVMYGRDAAEKFGESLAPAEQQDLIMGHSMRWYSEEQPEYSPFPDRDWNLPFTESSCLNCISGDWEQETGFTRNSATETEYIRDYGLRAIFANWAFQKNHHSEKERFANRKIKWISHLGGKREGYRVVGDYILRQSDLEEHTVYDDATACMTWSIDMHFPEPTNESEFGEAFRSFAYHRGFPIPYPVPYRCLYSRDIPNLFLGGRIVSTSHVAFSAIRVMRTLGQLGEVVGLAAAVCKQYDCMPRQVYTDHLDTLKKLMERGVDIPAAFNGSIGDYESYHFKDLGWWRLNDGTSDSLDKLEKFKRGVESLGLSHKHPLPEEWKKP